MDAAIFVRKSNTRAAGSQSRAGRVTHVFMCPMSINYMGNDVGAGTANDPRPGWSVRERLNGFKDLEDGWTPDDWSRAPDHAGLDWLADAFESMYPGDIPAPLTFPTPDGGVAFEWWFEWGQADLEIDIKKHTGEWFIYDENAKSTSDEADLNLAVPGDWPRVAELVMAAHARTGGAPSGGK